MNTLSTAHRLVIGRVLIDSGRFVIRNPLRCLLLAALMAPLTLVPPAVIDIDRPWFVHNDDWLYGVLIDGTNMLVVLLATAALAAPVVRSLRGQRIAGRAFVSRIPALGRLFLGSPALWLAPIIGSAIISYRYVDRPDQPQFVLLAWGVTVVVTLILLANLCVYAPVVVLEGAHPYAGLVRSVRLSRGRRWRIVGICLIAYGVHAAATTALTLAFNSTLEPGPVHAEDYARSAFVYAPLNILLVFWAVVAVTLYHHLRLEDEGMDSAHAAQVFD